MKTLAVVLWQVTALPLLWLGWLRWRGERREFGWWVMAVAFAVSWVSDLFGFVGRFDEASQVYPILQSTLFAVVLMPRWAAAVLSSGLLWLAVASIAIRHGVGFDVWLHVGAFLATAVTARATLLPSLLRQSLAWGFGALAVLWPLTVHAVAWPVTSYLLYKGAWCALTVSWCVVATRASRAA